MSTLHSLIVEKFLEKLSKSEEIDAAVASRVSRLLQGAKKPLKADDFVNAFTVTDETVK